ncbi:MAG TPA: hypothetical protein PKD55_01605 [Bellilinea sp.]|nr:hypothetical protein [Bellilinea sp.]
MTAAIFGGLTFGTGSFLRDSTVVKDFPHTEQRLASSGSLVPHVGQIFIFEGLFSVAISLSIRIELDSERKIIT